MKTKPSVELVNQLVLAEKIKEYLEKKYKIQDLAIDSKKREIIDIRSLAYKATKDICDKVSVTRIARLYKRKHSTVINAISNFESFMPYHYFSKYKKEYNIIMEKYAN